MKIKRSKILLISAILGTLYSLYLITYFSGGIFGSKGGMELAGAAMATALVTPHMVLVVLATIFNWVGYFSNKRGFALTGGILYSVGGVIFIIYIMFVIPSIILSFVGYAKLKDIIKINNAGKTTSQE